MVFINEDILKDKIKLIPLLEKEKLHINTLLLSQKKLKEILLDYMQKFADSTDDVDSNCVDTILKFLEELKKSLILVNHNLTSLKDYIKTLDDTLSKINTESNSLDDLPMNNFEIDDSIFQNILSIESFLHSILAYSELKFLKNVENISNEPKIEISKEETTTPSQKNEETSYIENTLVISDSKGEIILPYTLENLNQTLKDFPNEYSNIEDIINKNYTLSIDNFKNPVIARFREAYKLMRNKEKESIKASFDLGMELLFNYNLHPAIITACKDLDELDIYLDYLENNETEKFNCFKIIFEVAPMVVKN